MQETTETTRRPPAYVLDLARFDRLLTQRGYASYSDFSMRTGIPLRTLQAVLAHRYDLRGSTIRYFLDGFPGVSFEYLFRQNRTEVSS